MGKSGFSKGAAIQKSLGTTDLDSNQMKYIWIPSHIDVIGTDRADAIAKEALGIDYVNSTDYLEFEELFTLINNVYNK